jgi:hypothetical protein
VKDGIPVDALKPIRPLITELPNPDYAPVWLEQRFWDGEGTHRMCHLSHTEQNATDGRQ